MLYYRKRILYSLLETLLLTPLFFLYLYNDQKQANTYKALQLISNIQKASLQDGEIQHYVDRILTRIPASEQNFSHIFLWHQESGIAFARFYPLPRFYSKKKLEEHYEKTKRQIPKINDVRSLRYQSLTLIQAPIHQSQKGRPIHFIEIGFPFAPYTFFIKKAWSLIFFASTTFLLSLTIWIKALEWINRGIQNDKNQKNSELYHDTTNDLLESEKNGRLFKISAKPKGSLMITTKENVEIPSPPLPVDIEDHISLQLGAKTDSIKTHIIDPEKIISDYHEKISQELEMDIRAQANLEDVSNVILQKVSFILPGHSLSIFLRDSQTNQLVEIMRYDKAQVYSFFQNDTTLQEQVISETDELFLTLHNSSQGIYRYQAFWLPLHMNQVFLGAIMISLLDGKNLPSIHEKRLQKMSQSLSLTLFHFKLYEMAMTDSLTNFHSKRSFSRALTQFFQKVHTTSHKAFLVILDLDHFKQINDSYGHSSGDQLLKEFSLFLRKFQNDDRRIFRYGGEEFVVLVENCSKQEIIDLGEKMRLGTQEQTWLDEKIKLTVSIGIAMLEDQDSEAQWFKKADSALYKAKEAGRNRIHFFGDPILPVVNYHEKSIIDISDQERRRQQIVPSV